MGVILVLGKEEDLKVYTEHPAHLGYLQPNLFLFFLFWRYWADCFKIGLVNCAWRSVTILWRLIWRLLEVD